MTPAVLAPAGELPPTCPALLQRGSTKQVRAEWKAAEAEGNLLHPRRKMLEEMQKSNRTAWHTRQKARTSGEGAPPLAGVAPSGESDFAGPCIEELDSQP